MDDMDRQLIEAAQQGDAQSLGLLIGMVRPRVLDRLARRIPPQLRRIVDADDVVQEASTVATRRIQSFVSHDAESFFRWMTAIALQCLRDQIKRARAVKRGGVSGGTPLSAYRACESSFDLWNQLAVGQHTPSRSVRRDEAVDALLDALAALPDHYRQAIRLVCLERVPVAQAAARLNRSERAVHGLCRRGLILLSKALVSRSRFLTTLS